MASCPDRENFPSMLAQEDYDILTQYGVLKSDSPGAPTSVQEITTEDQEKLVKEAAARLDSNAVLIASSMKGDCFCRPPPAGPQAAPCDRCKRVWPAPCAAQFGVVDSCNPFVTL